MAINSIGSASFQAGSAMQSVASGNRINSAKDDATGLAISEKLDTQVRGVEQGTDNARDMQNLLKTAEGGLAGIEDNLQRIRELTLQAANGTLTKDDKRIIQTEINERVSEIEDTTQRVEYNTMKLLDGSAQNMHAAVAADGSGPDFDIATNMSALVSDLKNIDVVNGTTGNNLDIIDRAVTQVDGYRAELGVASNRLDHTINSNSIAMLNQADAKSRIADADIGKGMMEQKKEQMLNDMRILMQKQQQQAASAPLKILM